MRIAYRRKASMSYTKTLKAQEIVFKEDARIGKCLKRQHHYFHTKYQNDTKKILDNLMSLSKINFSWK